MKIKEGYNGKETSLRVNVQENGAIELWICETGKDNSETLSYLTADELLKLHQEIKFAGRDLFD